MRKCLIVFFSIFLLVGCPGYADYEYDLPNDYKLNRNSAHEIFIAPSEGWRIENEIIPAKVVELAWNSKYVVAKQLGLKYEKDNCSYQVPDQSKVYYWILDTETKNRLGPFDFNNFNVESKRLHIDNLKLKDVESYRTNI
ncbi:DUF3997 domain-containing protein [Cohnella sp. GCM10020058]|uniref:DUF3997 domain-containing protein n=1 Tax=Cohnella sp. GCM10020058 TaxID=3317330 RepID=UPI00363FED31